MKNVVDITERLRPKSAIHDSENSGAKWPIKQAVALFLAVALLAAFGYKFLGRPSYEPAGYYLVDSVIGLNSGPFATEEDCKRLAEPMHAPCRTGAELSAANPK